MTVEPCGGQWHDYPNCEDCPSLGDDCDGSDEYWESQKEISQAEDKRDADIEECKFCGTINNAHHSAACVDRSEAIQMEAIQHLIGRSHPSQIRN